MVEILKKIWRWIVSIPQDKLLHDYAGELISMYFFAFLIFLGFWKALLIADLVAACALVGKEVYDYFHPDGHSVEWKDVVFGLFGVLKFDVAALIGFLIFSLAA
jgi:hypothetical protein